MFCTKCGVENRQAAKFCDHCGAPMGAPGSSGASWLQRNPFDIIIRVVAIGLIFGLFVYIDGTSPPTSNPGDSGSNASPAASPDASPTASPENVATQAVKILKLTCGVQLLGSTEEYVVTGIGVNSGSQPLKGGLFPTMTVLSPDGTILTTGNGAGPDVLAPGQRFRIDMNDAQYDPGAGLGSESALRALMKRTKMKVPAFAVVKITDGSDTLVGPIKIPCHWLHINE